MRDWTLFWSFNSGPHSWQDATIEIFCFHQIFQIKTFILKMEIIWWECIHFILFRLFAIILYMCSIAIYMWPTNNSTEYTAGNPIFLKIVQIKRLFCYHGILNKNLNKSMQCSFSHLKQKWLDWKSVNFQGKATKMQYDETQGAN